MVGTKGVRNAAQPMHVPGHKGLYIVTSVLDAFFQSPFTRSNLAPWRTQNSGFIVFDEGHLYRRLV